MIQTFDQTGDINGQQLYRLARLYSLPPFVKKASSDDIYGTNQLETHQFADQLSRQFPCHTAASTYISTLFFLDKKASFNTDRAALIESRLDDFAFIYGINERISHLKTKLASVQPTDNINELPDDLFGLILESDESPSGTKERLYPMRNALEVKKCAEYLKDYRYAFPYKCRQKIASRVLDCANRFGAGLGDLDMFLEKQAGHGAAATFEIGKLLFDRARLLKRAGKLNFAVKVGEMAKTISGNTEAITDNDQLIKLACLVDDIDKETGLNRLVDDLQAPEDIFFNITEKIASQLRNEHFSTTSGNFYRTSDIENLKLAEVRDLMGSDFADAISTGGLFVSPEKIAEVVPTLPRGDAELFDRMLNSVGVNPVAKEAAHEHVGFDHDELKALATLHKSK